MDNWNVPEKLNKARLSGKNSMSTKKRALIKGWACAAVMCIFSNVQLTVSGNIQSVSLDCRHTGRYHNHIRFIFLCDGGLKDTLPISCSVWWLIFASLMIDWDGSHLKYSPKPATLIVIRDDKVPPKARLFVVFLCSVPPKKRNPTRRGRLSTAGLAPV